MEDEEKGSGMVMVEERGIERSMKENETEGKRENGELEKGTTKMEMEGQVRLKRKCYGILSMRM